MPEGRSGNFTVWKACQLFGVRPPGVAASWEDCTIEAQARLLAYCQIVEQDTARWQAALAGAKI